MIIYIDKSIHDCGIQAGLGDEEKILFEKLAMAHRTGKCLLCGDRESLDWLAEQMDDWRKKLFKKISGQTLYIKSIVLHVESLLVLSYNDIPSIPEFIGKKCRLLKMSDAINTSIDMLVSFVCENLVDCAFYKLIADRYRFVRNIKGVSIELRDELGGGDSMDTVFRKCIEDDRVLTLCVMDSDIKYGPIGKRAQDPKPGVTARKVQQQYERLCQTYCESMFELFCLPVHEIENLIPLEVLRTIAKDSVPDMKSGVEYLEKLANSENKEAILYYDFKQGRNKIKDGNSRTYWENIMHSIGDDSMPRLATKLMDKSVGVLKKMTPEGTISVMVVHIDDYLEDLWNIIGSKVFSWGCASEPERV